MGTKKKELDWSGLGTFMSILLDLFGIIRGTLSQMNVGIRIIPWAVGEGKEFFVEKCLKPLGEEFLKGNPVNSVVKKIESEFLRCISEGKTLMIDAVDGGEILAEAKELFAWIDPDLLNWGADQKGHSTGEILVEVYEMVKDVTFVKMFRSLSSDLDKLCFTQHQIKNFVKKHRDWLRTEGYGTFFLFKSNGKVFVAGVDFGSGGELGVDVFQFGRGGIWNAEEGHRVVVPLAV